MNALLIVDIQNDFLPGGNLAVPQGNEIIPVINKLQDKFELVAAVQDWHPANHVSLASKHPGKKPYDTIILDYGEQILWPDHCIQGSKGAEFSKELETNRIEAIIRKGTDPDIDSYSGFFDNQHRKTTGLADYLKGKQIDKIYIAGIAGDFCVNYTVNDAIDLGFKAAVIKDATRPINELNYEKDLVNLKNKGAEIITSREIL